MASARKPATTASKAQHLGASEGSVAGSVAEEGPHANTASNTKGMSHRTHLRWKKNQDQIRRDAEGRCGRYALARV